MENNQNLQDNELEQKTYDVVGLIIGGVVGLFISFIGIVNFLMGIILGMFVGLVIGTLIKKN